MKRFILALYIVILIALNIVVWSVIIEEAKAGEMIAVPTDAKASYI